MFELYCSRAKKKTATTATTKQKYVKRRHGSFNLGFWIRFHYNNANSRLDVKVSVIPFRWSVSKLHFLFCSRGSEKKDPGDEVALQVQTGMIKSGSQAEGGCLEWIEKIPFLF